jgi:hypothetical protein
MKNRLKTYNEIVDSTKESIKNLEWLLKKAKEDRDEAMKTAFLEKAFLFRPNNQVKFFQDMSVYKCLPSNIVFTAKSISENNVWLSGKGYGEIGGDYGNGGVCVLATEIIDNADEVNSNMVEVLCPQQAK